MKSTLWILGTLLCAPFVLPLYLAKRALQPGEVREGGYRLEQYEIFFTVMDNSHAFINRSRTDEYWWSRANTS